MNSAAKVQCTFADLPHNVLVRILRLLVDMHGVSHTKETLQCLSQFALASHKTLDAIKTLTSTKHPLQIQHVEMTHSMLHLLTMPLDQIGIARGVPLHVTVEHFPEPMPPQWPPQIHEPLSYRALQAEEKGLHVAVTFSNFKVSCTAPNPESPFHSSVKSINLTRSYQNNPGQNNCFGITCRAPFVNDFYQTPNGPPESCAGCKYTDTEKLHACKNVPRVRLDRLVVSSLHPLKNVQSLILYSTHITDILSTYPLEGLVELKTLHILGRSTLFPVRRDAHPKLSRVEVASPMCSGEVLRCFFGVPEIVLRDNYAIVDIPEGAICTERTKQVTILNCQRLQHISGLSRVRNVSLLYCDSLSDIAPLQFSHAVILVSLPRVTAVGSLQNVKELTIKDLPRLVSVRSLLSNTKRKGPTLCIQDCPKVKAARDGGN